MRLRQLMAESGTPGAAAWTGADPDVQALTADSRQVGPGALFAALPGTRADGRHFIPAALDRGAVAVLAPEDTPRPASAGAGVAFLTDPCPQRRLARFAAAFHGAQPAFVAAVTGTNGKTSVADFCRTIWTGTGHKAASLGTLGLVPPVVAAPGALTTPDPVALHRCLTELAAAGYDRLALEASSHGLAQGRLDGVRVRAAAFTNLTQDHLDYHGTMDAYLAAKLRLFAELLAPDGTAVVNAESSYAGRVVAALSGGERRVWLYGDSADAALRLLARDPDPEGQTLALDILGHRHELRLPLVGRFQALNALAALGLALAEGPAGEVDVAAALAALSPHPGIPGRLQRVAVTPGGAAVFVDYAHTPDALETVLAALRPHTAGHLHVVFGCGGDRDRGKRPLMGEIAARLADRIVVTDDNPRGEDPAAIRRAILTAAPEAREIGERGRAIAEAVATLAPGDCLLIAGKGHETGQIIGDTLRPFDDTTAARAAVAALSEGDAP